MKPILKSPNKLAPLLAFGAHPDDIEFACGGVIARETRAGRPVHFVVCSRGESGTYGSPKERVAEAKKGAAILGATIEFIELDGDAHLEISNKHILTLAGIMRRIRPGIILAPSCVENQHPDHWRLGSMVRDATRLARYGRVKELLSQRPHTMERLYFYAVTPEAEPRDITPILINMTDPELLKAWQDSMEAHASQVKVRKYVHIQFTHAMHWGMRGGVCQAIALFPNELPVIDSLDQISSELA